MKELLHLHKLEILILMETKVTFSSIGNFFNNLGFSASTIVDPVGRSGGIWLIWNTNHVNYTPALSPLPERPYKENLKTLQIASTSHGWLLGTSMITPIRVSARAFPILTTMADPSNSLKGLTTVISFTWEAWDLNSLGPTTDKGWQILWKG
ncbi:hypothetical protein ACSBR1_011904 [Camellia fascicularis]